MSGAYFQHSASIWESFPELVPRQNAYSAVRETTSTVLIVAEAMHDSAPTDVRELTETLRGELKAVWSADSAAATLSRQDPRFEY
jgi:DNA/RNA-binding domain of Phe-tRNA-synthetase-like protein